MHYETIQFNASHSDHKFKTMNKVRSIFYTAALQTGFSIEFQVGGTIDLLQMKRVSLKCGLKNS